MDNKVTASASAAPSSIFAALQALHGATTPASRPSQRLGARYASIQRYREAANAANDAAFRAARVIEESPSAAQATAVASKAVLALTEAARLAGECGLTDSRSELLRRAECYSDAVTAFTDQANGQN